MIITNVISTATCKHHQDSWIILADINTGQCITEMVR